MFKQEITDNIIFVIYNFTYSIFRVSTIYVIIFKEVEKKTGSKKI